MDITITSGCDEIDVARTLFNEYVQALGADMGFQGYDKELMTLPGRYAPPDGRLLIAYAGNAAAGCVALRPLSADVCELKRLYVRPTFRRMGIGEALARRAVKDAAQIGYGRIVLDTLCSMTAAIGLYMKLGFFHIPSYYANPLPGAAFMGRDLLLREVEY